MYSSAWPRKWPAICVKHRTTECLAMSGFSPTTLVKDVPVGVDARWPLSMQSCLALKRLSKDELQAGL